MSRVEEIEAAIESLAPDEYMRFVEWFRAREEQRWDDQMDRDSASGKLDFLFAEAKEERAGCLRESPALDPLSVPKS